MINNTQVTVPRYRKNPLIIPFGMLCPGISQNSKHHQLTLYKGQVWEEKSYLELCNHNVLNIAYDPISLIFGDMMEQNGELYIPPVPGVGFLESYRTLVSYDSEILQSFADLTKITRITFHSFDSYEDSLNYVAYHIKVGSYLCTPYHWEQCVPPNRYIPFYIWTKEGFKIKMK